ncbi:cytochrome o ubiquinol oxidase subunit IV [Buchnera aphidicola]|uniref:Cytochrome bo(3) ubiquinol oxidase subunit 4 n=1 Tax=Buchnera aphidicola (Aphis aurantii) TaxID=1470492 RepID=A0AAU6W553_9GAMM
MHKCFKFYLDKKVQSYIYSFLLSILLTIVPFFISKNNFLPHLTNKLIILLCAFIQIVIHFVYFLHLNSMKKKNWYLTSLLFILIIIFIVIFGSIWIMFNLKHHVMMI